MNKTEYWEFVLNQEVEKENPKAPDFSGDAGIGGTLYDACAWFGEIRQGKNAGRPYIGLQFSSKTNTSSQKINVSLWEAPKRLKASDPHFKTSEEFNGSQLKFAAWVESMESFYQLRVRIEPFTAAPGDLSEESFASHQRITRFVQEAKLRLPTSAEAAIAPTHLSKAVRRDPTLGGEPDDIPF